MIDLKIVLNYFTCVSSTTKIPSLIHSDGEGGIFIPIEGLLKNTR